MARRDRSDSEPPPPSEEKRGRLESVIPDLIKKAVQGGFDKASDAQESIKSFISESKLPKDIASAILQQIDDTKSGLFRVVAKEIRGFLEAIDFQRELQRLLTTVSFEIKTEIRFVPNESAPEKLGRPQVKADVKMKRQDRDARDDRKKGRRGQTDDATRETRAATDEGPEAPDETLASPTNDVAAAHDRGEAGNVDEKSGIESEKNQAADTIGDADDESIE